MGRCMGKKKQATESAFTRHQFPRPSLPIWSFSNMQLGVISWRTGCTELRESIGTRHGNEQECKSFKEPSEWKHLQPPFLNSTQAWSAPHPTTLPQSRVSSARYLKTCLKICKAGEEPRRDIQQQQKNNSAKDSLCRVNLESSTTGKKPRSADTKHMLVLQTSLSTI